MPYRISKVEIISEFVRLLIKHGWKYVLAFIARVFQDVGALEANVNRTMNLS